MELLCLDLRSALIYVGLENPPISGAPFTGEDMAEGDEEVFFFAEDDLVDFDPDEGPVVRHGLPAPRFYGRRTTAPEEARAELEAAVPPAGPQAKPPSRACGFRQALTRLPNGDPPTRRL